MSSITRQLSRKSPSVPETRLPDTQHQQDAASSNQSLPRPPHPLTHPCSGTSDRQPTDAFALSPRLRTSLCPMLNRNCSLQTPRGQENSLFFRIHIAFISPEASKTHSSTEATPSCYAPTFVCSPVWSSLCPTRLPGSLQPHTVHHSWEHQQPYGLTKNYGLAVP